MPWRNTPPDWLKGLLSPEFWQGVKALLAAMVAAGVGLMARITEEVKMGVREKVVSKQLWLEVPALLMASLLVMGAAGHYSLSSEVSAALGAFVGYGGPKAVEGFLARKTGGK